MRLKRKKSEGKRTKRSKQMLYVIVDIEQGEVVGLLFHDEAKVGERKKVEEFEMQGFDTRRLGVPGGGEGHVRMEEMEEMEEMQAYLRGGC